MSSTRVFKLKASDGEIFEVVQSISEQFEMVKRLLEDDKNENEIQINEIPLMNVDGKTLAKAIEWCKEPAATGYGKKSEAELKEWDKKFLGVDQADLYDLIMAANYLEVKDFLDQICDKAADMIKGKKPEEIRAIFKIESEFTPEEEEKMRKENAWAFD